MKHQEVILSQRFSNMKEGITTTQEHISNFINCLSQQIENNKISQENLLEELDEIQSLLDWIRNQ